MIDVQVHDGRYVITLPKTVLVLTRAEFIQALRRGKWWRRREALKARQGRHEASPPAPGRAEGGDHACLTPDPSPDRAAVGTGEAGLSV